MKIYSEEELKATELAKKILRTGIVPMEINKEFDNNEENAYLPYEIRMYDAIITVVQKKAKKQKKSEMDILTDFEKIVDKNSTTGSSDDEGDLEFKYNKDKSKSKNNIKQYSTGKSVAKNTTKSATNTASTTSRNTTSTTVSIPISVSQQSVPKPIEVIENEDEDEFEI